MNKPISETRLNAGTENGESVLGGNGAVSPEEFRRQIADIAENGRNYPRKKVVGESNREVYKAELKKEIDKYEAQSDEFYNKADAAYNARPHIVSFHDTPEEHAEKRQRWDELTAEYKEYREKAAEAYSKSSALGEELNKYQHVVTRKGKPVLEIDAEPWRG